MEITTRKIRALALAGLAAAGAGCTGAANGVQGRFVAVHNTLEVLGMNQVGHISEGSLPDDGTARFPLDLEAQCYTFVGFSGDGARDLDLTVLDGANTRVAADTTHDASATLRYCPTTRGHYVLTVHMAGGGGSYLVSSWRGGAASTSGGASGAGTCAEPLLLAVGQTVTGDTSHAQSHNDGSCIAGGGEDDEGGGGRSRAPEVVYALTVERRQQVTVAVEQGADYDGAVYIRRANCDQQGAEVPNGCNDDDGDTHHSRVSVPLDPGQYYVFVDGFGESRGTYTLTVTAQDVPEPAQVCGAAETLAPNTPRQGQLTAQDPNVFTARCGNGARGPDRVYRLEVPAESRLQLSEESDFDGVVYLRRACAEASTELECNDDAWDTQHSRINTVVPAGTYYVFSDAYQANGAGTYTLEADLAPVAGGSTPGDTCADAVPLTPGTPVEGNTFQAHDDVPSPCAAQQDGYDVVYRLDVPARSHVRVWFEQADLADQATLAITRNCGQIATDASTVCRPGVVGEQRALDQVLDAGTYFVVVDSAAPRRFGRFRLNARVEDLAAVERLCRAAPVIVPGHTVTGTTSGTDHFQATCGSNARSPENLYRFHLARRSNVRLALSTTTQNYDAVLHLRSSCPDPGTERACNDDSGDTQHSLIETTLDAGNYTVFVDGFGTSNQGGYTLEFQTSAATGPASAPTPPGNAAPLQSPVRPGAGGVRAPQGGAARPTPPVAPHPPTPAH